MTKKKAARKQPTKSYRKLDSSQSESESVSEQPTTSKVGVIEIISHVVVIIYSACYIASVSLNISENFINYNFKNVYCYINLIR